MAKTLEDWVRTEVRKVRGRSVRWLTERYFFRDPRRPIYADPEFFYSPADGVILYQREVEPDQPLVEIKGCNYTLREAIRVPDYEQRCLVIGIFMTFYDVHVNRVPYAGTLTHRELEPVESYNRPMLAMEEALVDELRIDLDHADYLHHNQRVANQIYSWELGLSYFVLQIADYDVDSITPFDLSPHRSYCQNERFSQIRYGSQVDLVVPLSERFRFEPTHPVGTHVEAGVDTLIRIHENEHDV